MEKKCDFSDLTRMIVGDCWLADLNISVTADLFGFSCTTVSRVYSEITHGMTN